MDDNMIILALAAVAAVVAIGWLCFRLTEELLDMCDFMDID